jgi:hypothetical protein
MKHLNTEKQDRLAVIFDDQNQFIQIVNAKSTTFQTNHNHTPIIF